MTLRTFRVGHFTGLRYHTEAFSLSEILELPSFEPPLFALPLTALQDFLELLARCAQSERVFNGQLKLTRNKISLVVDRWLTHLHSAVV